ncbi:MAG: OmpA family protein [Bacteroidetes bacterium]|nr:OmpA family protein [Bacteroidota bacterium]
MSLNLMDSVKQLFTNEILNKAASSLGESQSGISNALSGVVPAVISGIITKATTGEHGASNILQLAKDALRNGTLSNLGNLFNSGGNNSSLSAGFDIVKSLFGDKLTSVEHAVANFANVKTSSASALLSSAAPAALAVIGNHALSNNISSSALAQSLQNEKSSILNALPAGLGSLSSLLGLGTATVSNKAKNISAAASHYAHEAEEKAGSGMKFLIPLLLSVLVIALLIYLVKGCNNKSDATIAETTDTTAKANIDTTNLSGLVTVKVALPNGTELDAYKGGIEDQLVAFLKTDYAKLGEDSLKKTWFDFDNLNFKTASAEITPESQHQIDNIAAILKAFPKSAIKIGGYTDKTGDETVNKKLSKDRAEAVKAALEKAGVSKQVTGADGYGSDFAKYPATAPESDRVHDRRVFVSVRL